MADAPSTGGSSWGALEIILVAVLAIGFITQLQNGFKGTPSTPKTPDIVTDSNEAPCGLVLARPHSLEKVTSFITLVGRVEGCQWQATEMVALYAQVIDSSGRVLSDYISVPPINPEFETAAFDMTITLTATPATTKGFLILVPAKNTAQQTENYRIPLTFTRN